MLADPVAALNKHFGGDADATDFSEIRALVDRVWSGPRALYVDAGLVLTRREVEELSGRKEPGQR